MGMREEEEEGVEAEIDRLPIDVLAQVFVMIPSLTDLAQYVLDTEFIFSSPEKLFSLRLRVGVVVDSESWVVNKNENSRRASGVCRKWKRAVKLSLGRRESMSFAGLKMDDDSTARIIRRAYALRELDISRSRWGCHITDEGLYRISLAKCAGKLTSISLWGMTGVTDQGVVQLIAIANALRHLNVGGTFITDESLYAIANSCPHLKSIVLWSCRHVTQSGLLVLVNRCRKLESINVWGTRVPMDCFVNLLTINPGLRIK